MALLHSRYETGMDCDVISFNAAMSAGVRGQAVGANNDAASQVRGYGRVITAKHPLQRMSEASMMADVISFSTTI